MFIFPYDSVRTRFRNVVNFTSLYDNNRYNIIIIIRIYILYIKNILLGRYKNNNNNNTFRRPSNIDRFRHLSRACIYNVRRRLVFSPTRKIEFILKIDLTKLLLRIWDIIMFRFANGLRMLWFYYMLLLRRGFK